MRLPRREFVLRREGDPRAPASAETRPAPVTPSHACTLLQATGGPQRASLRQVYQAGQPGFDLNQGQSPERCDSAFSPCGLDCGHLPTLTEINEVLRQGFTVMAKESAHGDQGYPVAAGRRAQ